MGLNGGVVGLNPGVLGLNGGLLNPGLMVGGVNPALIGGGGAFIAQPPVAPVRTFFVYLFKCNCLYKVICTVIKVLMILFFFAFLLQMFPAIPPYMLQPQLGIPNAPAQLPQQFPFQPNGVRSLLCGVYIYTHPQSEER